VNYYEEFGVIPTASTEEIRQAYRLLARLLHPDAQLDPKMRAAADRQMQRVNEMLTVLTDPRRRREYDESLRAPLRSPVPTRRPAGVPRLPQRGAWRRVAARYWYAILIASTCAVAVIAWYAIAGGPTEALPMQGPAPLQGRWLYSGNDGAYLECVLQQEVDAVRGTCQTRDAQSAPDMAIRVSGSASSTTSTQLAWTAGDGAVGLMQLNLESLDRMRASWWTVKLGRRNAPMRGGGWLIRQEAR